MPVQSVSKLRCLFTDALSGSKSSKIIELEGYTVPPTFATAMLKLSPCQERTTSVFVPRSEGNVDGFYGHKSVAKASSAFITNTFGCPEESLLSKLFLQPSLPYFIASIIHETHVPYSVISAAHVLLQRYQSQLPPVFDSSKLTAHRLFLASYIFAVREHWPNNEKVFDNKYWSKMSNFSARDIDMMLDHFYDKLDGRVGVSYRIVDLKEEPIVIMEYQVVGGRTLKRRLSSLFSRRKRTSSTFMMF